MAHGDGHARRRKLEERQKFLELVHEGVSIREASRLVGINRRTGQEWINGRAERSKTSKTSGKKTRPAIQPITGEMRTFIPHPIHAERAKRQASASRRYLSEEERVRIADLRREQKSIRSIAVELGRSPSTISREIRRNCNPSLRPSHPSYYRPFSAHRRAEMRRPRPKPRRIEQCPDLREFIQARLDERWSPEQIANVLRRDFPDRPEMNVTHETIYRALYAQARDGLWREVTRRLRTGRRMRKRRRRVDQRTQRFIHPKIMISQRPAEADDRSVPGHWEGDLIVGAKNGSAIGTLVERSTRYTLLVHLPHGHSPGFVQKALLEAVNGLPPHLKRSLTWDQGSEMAHHYAFSEASGIPVYFCEPHSPWQRGTNENTNGLLRQYFPKGADLSKYTREDLDRAAAELNSRPRKALGWDSPAERLSRLLENDLTSRVATIC
ncbi:IS30 family transposase [Streptomyces jeddahensis]|uniref:Integrase core domain protein n=1 Tax=Streptomyces jeddahensis TaxID=1716141 RepID=A0A177HHX6_9ACTN|nr:IS30 family transposase [Streptomyces jeddahensis]OAH10561.1 integrase core domain protein [Streptomyces jeddahensis]